jgi:hypothetical protein
MIFAPMVVKQELVPGQNEAKEPSRLAGFRTAYVFDVTQTDGRPLPEFAKTTGDPKDYVGKLKTLVAKQGIAMEYDPTIAPAQGVSTGGSYPPHARLAARRGILGSGARTRSRDDAPR